MHFRRKTRETRRARSWFCVTVLYALAVACTPRHAPVPLTSPEASARFVATAPNEQEPPPRDRCWMSGRFEGTALLHERELEVVITRGDMATTRVNDKQWDDLHLTIDLSRHPLGPQQWMPVSRSATIALRGTVDSAGPQLTTWQSRDTLRVLLPWTPSLESRWLLFHLQYRTLSYSHQLSECSGLLGTDTLRFASTPRPT
jgi:hypothetical protein